jgi:MtN3 and saliva related transmembrane protein
MQANGIELIGYVAGMCTTVSFVPQLLRVLRLKSAREISLGMFLLFSFGCLLWLLYGVLVRSIPIMLWNAITFLLAMCILGLKLRYDRNALGEITPQKEKP